MEHIQMSVREAQEYLIVCHGLDSYRPMDKSGILAFFDRAGCVQYDPLDVVGRNPDLVLQSRFRGFHRQDLQEMLYKDRTLMDAWDKERAIYQTTDWPCFRRIRKEQERVQRYMLMRRNQSEALSYTDAILEELHSRGPLQAREIDLGDCNKARWGHRKISGAVMEYMFSAGVLGIVEKNGSQRRYDVIEHLIPEEILKAPDPFKTDDDFLCWYFKRRIQSVGMLWARAGGGWNGHFLEDKPLRARVLSLLLEKNEIVPCSVEGIAEPLYICREDAEKMGRKPHYDEAIHILAPLDNILWDRLLIKRLFHFDYSWEVYIPVAKRKFGYYVLPVLYQGRFVARFEPDLYRGEDTFQIKQWWWEQGAPVTPELLDACKKGLGFFAEYLQANNIDEKSFALLTQQQIQNGR